MDFDAGSGDPRRFAQKDAFALVRLDEMNGRDAKHCKDQPRESGAAADVEENPGARRNQRKELGRIENMTPPDVADSARPDEIDAPIPGGEQLDIGFESRQCFT